MPSSTASKRKCAYKPFKKATAGQTAAAIRLAAGTSTPFACYREMIRRNLWVTSLWADPVKWRLEVVLERMRKLPFVSDPRDHEALIGLLEARVGAPRPVLPQKPTTPSNQLSLL